MYNINSTTNACSDNATSLGHHPEDALWAQIFIWIANGIGLIYNIQVYHTYKTKRANDISSYFLMLRFISSIMWIFYCSYFFMPDVLVSWIITGCSSVVVIYYKYFYHNGHDHNGHDHDGHDHGHDHDGPQEHSHNQSYIERGDESVDTTNNNNNPTTCDYDIVILNSEPDDRI
jgi:hypothetical protein